MKELKTLKKRPMIKKTASKKVKSGNIKEQLEEILSKIEEEKDLYMSEVVFLQNHKEDIKRLFPNEPRLWQWADIPEEEYLKHSSLKRKAFKITGETNLWKFDAWSGAKETKKYILEAHKGDEFDALIEELYPDGIDETKLNDLLWFESEWLYETLGINPYEENDEEGEDNE